MFNVSDDVVFSIETTPMIAANEPEKIEAVYNMGYKRISMGFQTVSEKLLSELGRDSSKSIYEKAVHNIRKAGFKSFNIDLMYGFLHQRESDFDNTLRYAIGLNPEHISLYRNRYKGTKLEYEAGGVSIYKAMYQYRIAYRVLTEKGFNANVGKNTFSRVENDYGTSDYLTNRVINGTPYVGMGLGAQSFGMNYPAYNSGAAEKKKLESAFSKKQTPERSNEELFLSSYNIEDYDRPSIATDIAVFTMYSEESNSHRKDADPRLSVLLIKRGEHPFMNKWALPGGFLKSTETIEECAYREITEETNLTPVSLMPIGVFSEPDRDPRGRIISNAFVSIVSEENVKIMSGDDTIDAKWFDVDFHLKDNNIFQLGLVCGNEKIVAKLMEKEEILK